IELHDRRRRGSHRKARLDLNFRDPACYLVEDKQIGAIIVRHRPEGSQPASLNTVQPMPAGVLDDISAALAAENLTPTSFAGLVNSALLYGVTPDLSALAADALRRV